MSIRLGNRRRRSQSNNPLALLLFGGIFVACGVIFSGMGLYFMWEGWQSESWPTATGRIISHEIDIDTDDEGDTDYTPRIRYSYTVDDQRYTGTRIAILGRSYNSQREAQAKLDEYPIESQPTVYYKPSAPEQSVLEPGLTFGNYIFPFIGLIFVLVGIFMAANTVVRFLRGGFTMLPGK